MQPEIKTPVELPSDLLRRVKARATEQGRSMKSLVTEALENTLRQGQPATRVGAPCSVMQSRGDP